MVWYFIDVYIINRTLHGRLEIQNFSSRVEKIFHSFTLKRNFVSPRGHVISSIFFQCMHLVLDSSIFLGINLRPHYNYLDPVLIIEMLQLYPYMLTPSSLSRMQDLNAKQSPAAKLNTAPNI